MAELYTPPTWTNTNVQVTSTWTEPDIYVPSVVAPSYRQQYIQENYPTSPLLKLGYQQAAGFEMNPAFKYIASGTSQVAGTIRQGIPEVSSRLSTIPYVGVPLAVTTPYTSEFFAGTIEAAGMIPGGRQLLYERPWIIPTAVRYGVGETLRPYQEELALNRVERQESFEGIAQTFADIGTSYLLFKGVPIFRSPRASLGLKPKLTYPEGFMGESPRIYKPRLAFEEAFDPMRRPDVWDIRAKILRDFPLAYKPSTAFTQAFTKPQRFPELEKGFVWKRPVEIGIVQRGTYAEAIRPRIKTFPELEEGYIWKRGAAQYEPPSPYATEPRTISTYGKYFSETARDIWKTFSKYRPSGTFIREAGFKEVQSYFIGKKLSPEEIRAQRVEYGKPTFLKGTRPVSVEDYLLVTQEQKLIPLGRQIRQVARVGSSELYKAITKRAPEIAETVKKALPKRYTIESYLKQQVRIGRGLQEALQRGKGRSVFAERPRLKSRQRFISGLIPVMRFRTETGLGLRDVSGIASKQMHRQAETTMQRLDTTQTTGQAQTERFITIPRIKFPTPTIIKPTTITTPRPPPKKPPTRLPPTKPPTIRIRKPRIPKPGRKLPESEYGRKTGLMGFGRFGEIARIRSAKEMLRGI